MTSDSGAGAAARPGWMHEHFSRRSTGRPGARTAGSRATTPVEQLASCRDSLRAVDIDLQVEGPPSALSPVQAITASWILREATTNALRHSEAQVVRVRIAPGRLCVEDDGVGVQGVEGNGIRGMRNRAAAAGAAFALESGTSGSQGGEPGGRAGTCVEVTW